MSDAVLGVMQAAEPIPGDRLREIIVRQILASLGRPLDLLRVQVSALWGNRFRVNVITGDSITAMRIEGSFFIEADAQGNVLHSSPALALQRW